MAAARLCLIVLACLPGLASAALRVCADPNNLPFSNQHQAGFENRLAQILARELHTGVQYEWWAQRRGFARQTLAQARCDIWPGVAAGLHTMATSRPYYTSSYVYVSLSSRHLDRLSLDDPRLRHLVIAVQLVGDDGMNTPPASALARRGLTGNVRGFTLYGDYRRPDPPNAILDAVENGQVDLALVWGPLAGYYARHCARPLRLQPILADAQDAEPMHFDIAVGVRRDEPALLARVNRALAVNAAQISRLLNDYGVPVTEGQDIAGSGLPAAPEPESAAVHAGLNPTQ